MVAFALTMTPTAWTNVNYPLTFERGRVAFEATHYPGGTSYSAYLSASNFQWQSGNVAIHNLGGVSVAAIVEQLTIAGGFLVHRSITVLEQASSARTSTFPQSTWRRSRAIQSCSR
jgi:hypothetical protein